MLRLWIYAWREHNRKIIAVYTALFAAAVLIIITGNMWHNLKNLVGVYGEAQCRSTVTDLLLDAAGSVQWKGELCSFSETEKQDFIRLDSAEVNRVRTALGKAVTERLGTLEALSQPVSLGTLMDLPLIAERGPRLNLRFLPVGAAQIDVCSTTKAAGLNRTLYQVAARLSVTMTVVLPGETREIFCSQDVVLEEILLSGQVPMAYGTVDKSGEAW